MAKVSPFQQLLELDNRFRKHAASLPARQEAGEFWSGVGFRMGQNYYVAPMSEVAEVLPEPRFTLLPGVKDWVRGVANVRGRLLPVMDLCGFFGMSLSGSRKSRRVIVLEHQGLFAGLTVDEVLGMQHFSAEEFSEQVDSLPERVWPFVHGSFQRERSWVVFSPFMLATDSSFLDVVA